MHSVSRGQGEEGTATQNSTGGADRKVNAIGHRGKRGNTRKPKAYDKCL